MTEWKEVKLMEIAEVIGGGTPKTSEKYYWDGNIPWVTPRDLTGYNNVYISHGDRFISESGLKNSSAKLLPKGTVLLTSRAPIGYVAIAENEICTNQGFKSLIPKKDAVNSAFLYYWIKANQDYLKQLGTGTTFAEISGKVVNQIPILLPPLPEQKAIAGVLSSLDDKIDLLHRQNKTLEAMAETLFREWFIENAEDDWEEVELSDLIEIKGGFSYKGEYIGKGSFLLLGMGCVSFSDRFLYTGARSYSGECPNNHLAKPGDIVIATRQQSDNMPILGFPALIPEDFKRKKIIVGTNLYRLINNSYFDNYFFYKLFRSDEYQCHIKSCAKGSTVRMITKDAIESFVVKKPPTEKYFQYQEISKPINNNIINIISQIQTLQTLRDTLLPYLMNNKIKVTH